MTLEADPPPLWFLHAEIETDTGTVRRTFPITGETAARLFNLPREVLPTHDEVVTLLLAEETVKAVRDAMVVKAVVG